MQDVSCIGLPFFGLHDDDETFFACLAYLNFMSSSIFFISSSSSRTNSNILCIITKFFGMKLNPLADDDKGDEEDESLIVAYLCIPKLQT